MTGLLIFIDYKDCYVKEGYNFSVFFQNPEGTRIQILS